MCDFVHCNVCFLLPSVNSEYYLTSCSHIICSQCITNGFHKTRRCLKCDKACEIMLISNEIKNEIKIFFEPLQMLINKIQQVDKFQRTQRFHLLSHLVKKKIKNKENEEKTEKKINDLKKEIYNLKMKLNSKSDIEQPNNKFSKFYQSSFSNNNNLFKLYMAPLSKNEEIYTKKYKEKKFRLPESQSSDASTKNEKLNYQSIFRK